MSDPTTIQVSVHFRKSNRGRKRMQVGVAPTPRPCAPGRVPLVSKLAALALHIQDLIDQGVVRDFAEVARLGGVTRARVTQVMHLADLAPDIIEDLLFLPLSQAGRDAITERQLRHIVAETDFERQRRLWLALRTQQMPLSLQSTHDRAGV